MKKTYIKPELIVYKIATVSIIALSIELNEEEEGTFEGGV